MQNISRRAIHVRQHLLQPRPFRGPLHLPKEATAVTAACRDAPLQPNTLQCLGTRQCPFPHPSILRVCLCQISFFAKPSAGRPPAWPSTPCFVCHPARTTTAFPQHTSWAPDYPLQSAIPSYQQQHAPGGPPCQPAWWCTHLDHRLLPFCVMRLALPHALLRVELVAAKTARSPSSHSQSTHPCSCARAEHTRLMLNPLGESAADPHP
jgi:hypothetical protein